MGALEGLVADINASDAGLHMLTDENAHSHYVMVMIIISRSVEPLYRLVMVMCLSCFQTGVIATLAAAAINLRNFALLSSSGVASRLLPLEVDGWYA